MHFSLRCLGAFALTTLILGAGVRPGLAQFDLVLNLDASDLASLNGGEPVADGVAVSSWGQSFGISAFYDLFQGAGASQPTFVADGLNGNPVVRFDGMDDFLADTPTNAPNGPLNPSGSGGRRDSQFANFIDSPDWTMFFVASNTHEFDAGDATVDPRNLLTYGRSDSAAGDSRWEIVSAVNDNMVTRNWWYRSFSDQTLSGPADASNAEFAVRSVSGELNTVPMPINERRVSWLTGGVAAGTEAVPDTDLDNHNQRLVLGARNAPTPTGTSNHFGGDVAQIAIFSGSLSEQQRLDVQAALADKWGLDPIAGGSAGAGNALLQQQAPLGGYDFNFYPEDDLTATADELDGWAPLVTGAGYSFSEIRPGGGVQYPAIANDQTDPDGPTFQNGYDEGFVRPGYFPTNGAPFIGVDHQDVTDPAVGSPAGNDGKLSAWGEYVTTEQGPWATVIDRMNPDANAFADGTGYLGTDVGAFNGSGEEIPSPFYFEFTVTPAAGKLLDLSELRFSLNVRSDFDVDSAGVYVETAETLAFEDQTPADVIATVIDINDGGPFESAVTNDQLVDLSGVEALQGLGGEATFRIYLWRNGGTDTLNVLNNEGANFDDVLLFGAVIDAPGTPGDFNGDGVVTAADYTVWRDNLGAEEDGTVLAGNGDGGQVTIDDYNLWVANFGEAGVGGGPVAATPEPASTLAAGVGLVAVASWRRRGARRARG